MNNSILFFSIIFCFSSIYANTFKVEKLLISEVEYYQLSRSHKIEYLKKTRALVNALEKESFKKTGNKIIAGHYNKKNRTTASVDGNNFCVLGGRVINEFEQACSTNGFKCDGDKSYKCGTIYGGACVTFENPTQIPSKCMLHAESVSADDFRSFRAEYINSIEEICNDEDKIEGCGKAITDLNVLRSQYSAEEKKISDADLQTIVGDSKEKYNVPGAETCKPDRNQGQNGTCHAFCLTCTYDQMVKTKTGKDSRVSSNWIAMMSVVDRVCDLPGSSAKMSDKLLSEGWLPQRNMTLLGTYGACQESSFIPYSKEEGKDWAKGFSTRPNPAMGYNPPPKFDDPYWKKQFGIEGKDAYDLFCPKRLKGIMSQRDLKRYESKLEDLNKNNKIDPKFYKCAKESLASREELKLAGEKTKCKFSMFHPFWKPVPIVNKLYNPVKRLKKVLKESKRPVPIAFLTNPDSEMSGHCITVVGFDDEKKEFITVNSWGSDQKYNRIPYSDSNSLRSFFNPSCLTGNDSNDGGDAVQDGDDASPDKRTSSDEETADSATNN